MSEKEITGAEIVIRCLQEEGVDVVFGYPGGAVLFIYDELFKQDKVKHVLVRHEQGAAHAADAYSRASNRVGVCLVTSGPGVTNAVTIAADAVKELTLVGPGAGGDATASAVVADIADIARGVRSPPFGLPTASLAQVERLTASVDGLRVP